jgi:hypothetical protein
MLWADEALCAGLETNDFFDNYEVDDNIARKTDAMCMGCPVIKECFDYGVSTESWGVWGGIYLVDGKIDNSRNAHKTNQSWTRLQGVLS